MNLIELYEKEQENRAAAGEITEKTRRKKINRAAKVLEAVVGVLPAGVVDAIVREWGATYCTGTINELRDLAHERRDKNWPTEL